MATRADVRAAKEEKARRLAARRTVDWCRVYLPCIELQDGRKVPFAPYWFQAEVMDALDAGGPVIINKARQIGLSTTVMVHTARELIEREGITIVVISRKEKVAQELVAKCKLAVQTAQRPGKPEIVTDNKTELALSNGARVIAETASEEAGRTFAARPLVRGEGAVRTWRGAP